MGTTLERAEVWRSMIMISYVITNYATERSRQMKSLVRGCFARGVRVEFLGVLSLEQ